MEILYIDIKLLSGSTVIEKITLPYTFFFFLKKGKIYNELLRVDGMR